MHPDRRTRATFLLPALVLLVAAATTSAQAPAAGDWKLFQEFNFLSGSWSGPAESGGRIGGRVVTLATEVDGAMLRYRATTFFPAKDTLPELRTEELGHIVYDSARGKYVALVVFSTKAWGVYDAEVRPDGSIIFVSREMANLEAGTRSRWTLLKKADGSIAETLEVAPPSRDFVPFLGATLAKK
jgi:hypothetical protein